MTKDQILKHMKKFPSFYQKVWLECAKIPPGETRTYGWIANQIGHPGSARAVGRALAENPFAPAVPCHRVIRSDGSMGGYSAPGGIAKKQKMIRRESAGRRDSAPPPGH